MNNYSMVAKEIMRTFLENVRNLREKKMIVHMILPKYRVISIA